MARKRKSDGSASFDSLLDTMTNVVGILVIMLVVTLLGVRDAVRRVKWELPDISEAQLKEFRDLAEDKERELSDALADIEETERVLAELMKLKQQIALLEQEETLPQEKLDQLAAAIEELRKRNLELEKNEEKDRKKLEDLRKQLARLPEENPEANKVVRMPNPRSAPKGSTPVWFMCRYNRISPMDRDELVEKGLKRIEQARYQLSVRERGKVVRLAPEGRNEDILRQAARWVLDPERLVEYFEKNDIGTDDYRLWVELHPTLKKERLYARLRENAGESMRQLRTTVSRFESAIRDIDTDTQYARFLVYPDSFEIYVRAREIVEQHDVPAGWIIYTADGYQLAYDFGVHVQGETDPPPPPPPDATAKPAEPAPKVVPEAVLD
jgi:hypothetical protein